ncbi:MAG TPA: hypothetical protein VJB99_02475 [Patescibacteria group bacterium]|nr:hypothetical protein [Patescibacteria group bacterium]
MSTSTHEEIVSRFQRILQEAKEKGVVVQTTDRTKAEPLLADVAQMADVIHEANSQLEFQRNPQKERELLDLLKKGRDLLVQYEDGLHSLWQALKKETRQPASAETLELEKRIEQAREVTGAELRFTSKELKEQGYLEGGRDLDEELRRAEISRKGDDETTWANPWGWKEGRVMVKPGKRPEGSEGRRF